MTFKMVLRNRRKDLTYLSFDPGIKNFAYAVICGDKLIENGFIKHTIEKNTKEYRDPCKAELRALVERVKPDIITAERFMTRSFLASMSELVGVMVGFIDIIAEQNNAHFETITAASWKLSIKKILDLKQLYKDAWKKHKIRPHPIDCICMRCYVMNKFQFYPNDKHWIYKNIANCSGELK